MTTIAHKNKVKSGFYIGRAYSMMPQSVYANPYHIGKDGTRDEVILKFTVYWYAPEQKELRAQACKELSYRVITCWCDVPKEKCHGDIIAGYVNAREIFDWPVSLV